MSCRGHRRLREFFKCMAQRNDCKLTEDLPRVRLVIAGSHCNKTGSKPKHRGLAQPPLPTARTLCCTKGKYCSYISKGLSERFSTPRPQHCGSPAGSNSYHVVPHDPSQVLCQCEVRHTLHMGQSAMAATAQDTNNSL